MPLRSFQGLQDSTTKRGHVLTRSSCLWGFLFSLGSIFFAGACTSGGTHYHEVISPNSAERLYGYWKTETRLTQLGKGFDTVCFHQDGTYMMLFCAEGTQLVERGTYMVEGDMIRFNGPNGVYEEGFVLSKGGLEIDQKYGEPLIYRWFNQGCPKRCQGF